MLWLGLAIGLFLLAILVLSGAEERRLLERAGRGEKSAFDDLMRRYEKQVFHLAYRLTRDRDDAEDLAQETRTAVWSSLPRFRYESSFSTWLYRVLYNTWVRGLRKKRVDTVSIHAVVGSDGELIEDTDRLAPLADEDADPYLAVEMSERSAAFSKLLDELEETQRAVVIMADWQGLSYDEISHVLGCPVGTVRSRLNRGRCRLRTLLSERFKELFPKATASLSSPAAGVPGTTAPKRSGGAKRGEEL